MKDLIIKNGIIVTMEKDCQPFVGDMLIHKGKIVNVKETITDKTKDTIDATGYIVFPGLVNGHIHGDSTMLRGIGDNLTLTEQNNIYQEYNYFKDLITDEDRCSSRELTYLEALRSGTTFLMDFEYWDLKDAVSVMNKTGIDGAIARNIYKDFQKSNEFIDDNEINQFIAECKAAEIIPLLSGPSEEYFDLKSMKKLYEYAKKKNVSVTQHFAETDYRMRFLMNKYHTTPSRFMIENDLLDKVPVIASHSVHVSKDEISELAYYPFSVVNSTVSEQKIADGIAPIPQYIQAGIHVGLGTDGAEWNNGADMFREMKSLLLLHNVTSGIRCLTTRQVLEIGTIEGARALGLEDDMGSLTPGKKANFIMIDTKKNYHMQPLRVNEHENILSTILYQVTGSDVTNVFVKGVQRVKEGEIVDANMKELFSKVQQASEHVLAHYTEQQLGEIH